MKIGRRKDIFEEAGNLKLKYNGDLYGLSENGGTSNVYVSDIDFGDLDQALAVQSKAPPKAPATG